MKFVKIIVKGFDIPSVKIVEIFMKINRKTG